ncbi:hypothetical protein D3C87_900560 [compost metagenome]
MRTSSGRRPFGVSRLWPLGLAVAVALAGCRGESQESNSEPPETQSVAGVEAPQAAGEVPQAAKQAPKAPETQTVDTPEAQAQLANELAESRTQARAKQEPVDPELEKRMKDPEYRKQKDAMLNQLSQVSNAYFQEGIEIRHTRKRPEWRLIDPTLATIKDPAERRKKGETLAKRFKGEVEPVLDKTITVIVFADASESIQVY